MRLDHLKVRLGNSPRKRPIRSFSDSRQIRKSWTRWPSFLHGGHSWQPWAADPLLSDQAAFFLKVVDR
jgi:hypothetical protein